MIEKINKTNHLNTPSLSSTKPSFYPALHSLRGFAALWVLLFHVKALTGIPQITLGFNRFSMDLSVFASSGHLGVQLFFILSAFLLGLHYFQTIQNHWSYRGYLVKRIARIYPAYLAQLAILMTFGAWFGFHRTLDTNEFIAHLFLYFNLPPSHIMQLNGVWWTLPIEFGFYIILPLMTGLLIHLGWLWMYIIILLVTLSYRWVIYQQVGDQSVLQLIAIIEQLPGELSVFAVGIICAWLSIRYENKKFFFRSGAIIALVLTSLWVINQTHHISTYWHGSWLLYCWESINAILFGAFIFFLTRFKVKDNNFITHPVLLWLGEISYGIYLWQLPMLQLLLPTLKQKFEGISLFWYALGSTSCLTIVCAAISYYLIEKPGIRFGRSIAVKFQ